MGRTMVIEARPSLEALVEHEDLGVAVLHPGGLAITAELAEMCAVRPGARVLDLASGTGESACFLAERFHARIVGLDVSARMVRTATQKAHARQLMGWFTQGDAHELPFATATFDAAICECTLSLFNKGRVLRELVRVVRLGGYVGVHDLCWRGTVPEKLKRRLWEIEGEQPETLEGWKLLFATAGLIEPRVADRSSVMRHWMKDARQSLGLRGQARLAGRALKRWGFSGLLAALRSERVFSSRFTGYCIVVGRKG